MVTPIVQILGPGGAGKSTVGPLLAKKLRYSCIDLDAHFLENTGHIARFIEQHGYAAYAKQNVRHYSAILQNAREPLVLVLSSGFMNYSTDVDPLYLELRSDIEGHPLSALLLPSFDLEECAAIIISRQLSRTYLAADGQREAERIRARFPHFMALRCKRFLSKKHPDQIADELEQFVLDQETSNNASS